MADLRLHQIAFWHKPFCYLAHFDKADICRRTEQRRFPTKIRRKVVRRRTTWEGVALSVQSSSYFPLLSRRWKKAKKRREWLVGSRRQDSSNIATSQNGDGGRGWFRVDVGGVSEECFI